MSAPYRDSTPEHEQAPPTRWYQRLCALRGHGTWRLYPRPGRFTQEQVDALRLWVNQGQPGFPPCPKWSWFCGSCGLRPRGGSYLPIWGRAVLRAREAWCRRYHHDVVEREAVDTLMLGGKVIHTAYDCAVRGLRDV